MSSDSLTIHSYRVVDSNDPKNGFGYAVFLPAAKKDPLLLQKIHDIALPYFASCYKMFHYLCEQEEIILFIEGSRLLQIRNLRNKVPVGDVENGSLLKPFAESIVSPCLVTKNFYDDPFDVLKDEGPVKVIAIWYGSRLVGANFDKEDPERVRLRERIAALP